MLFIEKLTTIRLMMISFSKIITVTGPFRVPRKASVTKVLTQLFDVERPRGANTRLYELAAFGITSDRTEITVIKIMVLFVIE